MADLVSEMAGNKLGLRKHEALNGRNVSKIVKTNGFVGFLLYIQRDKTFVYLQGLKSPKFLWK